MMLAHTRIGMLATPEVASAAHDLFTQAVEALKHENYGPYFAALLSYQLACAEMLKETEATDQERAKRATKSALLRAALPSRDKGAPSSDSDGSRTTELPDRPSAP